jgi:hypothetical protein
MKARTSVLIILITMTAVFLLATVSHGYPAQTTPDQGRTVQQNQSGNNSNLNKDLSGSENGQQSTTNEAGAQGETPRTGRPLQPVIIRHVGWSWLLIAGLIGYLLGRMSPRRRPYGRDEDIRRNRAA